MSNNINAVCGTTPTPTEITVELTRAKTKGPLPTFNLNGPDQICTFRLLSNFLAEIKFDAINKQAHLHYGKQPVHDDENVIINKFLYKNSTGNKSVVLSFFKYGNSITKNQLLQLFNKNLALLKRLLVLRIILRTAQGSYRLNNLTLVSYRLANGKVMHLFAQLPEELGNPQKPTAQISGTSFILLKYLEQRFNENERLSGHIADFGSGIGTQAIALLLMHNGIQKAFGVEIDSASMNLMRLNAMLNRVENKVVLVDNRSLKNLPRALGRNKLSAAVSNPPFNPVPKQYSRRFTVFGDGGPTGLDVTKIFIRQAMQTLQTGGKLIFYSQLALDREARPLLTRWLKSQSGFSCTYFNLVNFERLDVSSKIWAWQLRKFIGSSSKEDASINRQLQRTNVYHLSPYIVEITKAPPGKKSFSRREAHIPSLESLYMFPKGGIREIIITAPKKPEGLPTIPKINLDHLFNTPPEPRP